MSVKSIINESISKNPVGLKEALIEELSRRITFAIEAKMSDKQDEDSDDDQDDDDNTCPECGCDYDGDGVCPDCEDDDKKKMSESAEQIDEISNKLLGRYIHKATKDLGKKYAEINKLTDVINNHTFSDKDTNYALEHDPETKRELSKARDKVADAVHKRVSKLDDRTWGREHGIQKAINNLAKRD